MTDPTTQPAPTVAAEFADWETDAQYHVRDAVVPDECACGLYWPCPLGAALTALDAATTAQAALLVAAREVVELADRESLGHLSLIGDDAIAALRAAVSGQEGT